MLLEVVQLRKSLCVPQLVFSSDFYSKFSQISCRNGLWIIFFSGIYSGFVKEFTLQLFQECIFNFCKPMFYTLLRFPQISTLEIIANLQRKQKYAVLMHLLNLFCYQLCFSKDYFQSIPELWFFRISLKKTFNRFFWKSIADSLQLSNKIFSRNFSHPIQIVFNINNIMN